ncbi:DUF2637 domain-containing protein [Nonomuraea sp. B19D2]|uniref:DUF2637 domain-containing protein n=1 Tax=Nonomuraea sp. B19D2 TaxID=3159561 RepID=UPI0032DB4B6D
MKRIRIKVDTVIRGAAYAGVSMVAGIAFVISYSHAYGVAIKYGESGMVARLVPLVIDGLLIVASVVQLDAARRGRKAGFLSWVALVVGIALTLGANVLHGIAHGPVGAVIASLPAITLTISFELLMHMIRRGAAVVHAVEGAQPDDADEPQAVEEETPEPAPVEVEEPKQEAPKRQRKPRAGTVGVAAHHVEGVKAYLANLSADELSNVTGESLASVLPNLVVRTRREALKRAKAEMGLDGSTKPAETTAEMLPGIAPATA